jgi:molybdate transport system substrate-binding protein
MRKFIVCLLLYTGIGSVNSAYADDIYVAAATSLTHVLKEIAIQFESETKHVVKLSFASSGNLAQQIIQGAPFKLFLSADETYVSLLHNRQLTDGSNDVYGTGRLVLFVPEGSDVLPSSDLSILADAIQNGQLKRLAIANPKHAPYGFIAKQALENAHVWETVMPYLVFGKSASQAALFALSNAVDAALIPYSLALIPEIGSRGQFIMVSDTLYTPLAQSMVLMQGAGSAVKEFRDFILGDEALSIFQHHGFGENNQSDLSDMRQSELNQ